MRHLHRVSFLLAILYICFGSDVHSHNLNEADMNRRYSVQIDIGDAYLSGLCIMHIENDIVTSSIVNEFGVSTLTYSYNSSKGRIKLISIVKQMNRWHIKKMLKSDLKVITKEILSISDKTPYEYQNTRFNIKYTFTPIN